MHKYRLIAKKGEGTFSEVLKAQSIKNGKYVAIKCMKNHFDSIDQVNNLREIQALRRLSPNSNIIKLLEVLYDQPTGRLALVFELMDMNIYELIRGRRHYLSESKVKTFMYQLIKSMDHMHRNGIFHRDIKPENILIADEQLKLADFGSCRGIYSKQPYTEYISTRWYRAPECLLTDGYYSYKMDMWGVGCVFFEIISLFPLFPGTNELDQVQKIHNILGTPPPEVLAKFKRHASHMDFNFPSKEGSGIAKLIPHASQECIELIMKLLAYNPDERLSARQALKHPYFKELRDAEKKQREQREMNAPATGRSQSTESQQKKAKAGGDGALPSIRSNAGGDHHDNTSSVSHGTDEDVNGASLPPISKRNGPGSTMMLKLDAKAGGNSNYKMPYGNSNYTKKMKDQRRKKESNKYVPQAGGGGGASSQYSGFSSKSSFNKGNGGLDSLKSNLYQVNRGGPNSDWSGKYVNGGSVKSNKKNGKKFY
eukprot:GFYU01001135.1.p1 GENE.GFYU01001135.1~~GFYU01001135.1.p1  ORF type:complete len:482 (-),score=125.48 GFYU01001135.1:676-2121(-)